jgi:hypothetical protein
MAGGEPPCHRLRQPVTAFVDPEPARNLLVGELGARHDMSTTPEKELPMTSPEIAQLLIAIALAVFGIFAHRALGPPVTRAVARYRGV